MKYFYKNINGKKKRVSQAQYIAENINDIEPQKLNAKGREIYSKIAFEIEQAKENERRRLEKNQKISDKAKQRLRNPNGSFLTAEDKRRINYIIESRNVINKATGKRFTIQELNQNQLKALYDLPQFFTVNSMSIIERINNNKMALFIDGVQMSKEEATEAVNLRTNANFKEWREKVNKNIYGFIYNCEWHPKTRELYISTNITDSKQILLSEKKKKKDDKTKKSNRTK
jgi:hypothetical protein